MCHFIVLFSNVFGAMSLLLFFQCFGLCLCSCYYFSNVSVIQKQKTLEQPIKAMRTMILELFRPDGVTPADRLKIMVVISVFQGFWLLACHFILFFFPMFWGVPLFLFFLLFWIPCMVSRNVRERTSDKSDNRGCATHLRRSVLHPRAP